MKKRFISLLVIALLITGICGNTLSAENPTQLSLNDMLEKLVNESTEIKNIGINEAILNVKHEKTIKDYEEFKERTIKEAENTILLTKSTLDKTMSELGKNGGAAGGIIDAQLAAYRHARVTMKNNVLDYINRLKSVEPLILQKKQSERQKLAETEKLKYNFRKDYYDLYSTIKQLDNLKTDLDLLNKQIDVEKIKKENGMSTDINIEDLEKQKRDLEVNVQEVENNVEMLKQTIKTKLNIDVESEISIAFVLPDYINKTEAEFKLKDALNKFTELNLEYELQKNNENVSSEVFKAYDLAYSYNPDIEVWGPILKEDEQNNLKTAELEYEKAKNETISTKKNMDLYVNRTYFNYKKALLNLNYNLETKKLLKQKGEIIEANYSQGLISKLQYDTQKHDLRKKEFEVEKAIIAFDQAWGQMDLVMKGIMLK